MILEKGKTILEKKNLFLDFVFFLSDFQNLNTKSHKPRTKKRNPDLGFLLLYVKTLKSYLSLCLFGIGLEGRGLEGRCGLGST